MDDAEYIYKQDVKEKAITARSSHKYGSSRRRRCGLSSDNLTRKEWERMNGPVHTLKPDEALSWDRFRALPRSLQQDYIKHILSKFKVGPAALGRMFGVSEAYCESPSRDARPDRRPCVSSMPTAPTVSRFAPIKKAPNLRGSL